MTEAEQREPLTLTSLATELGEVEQLLIELAGRLSSLKEYVELARSRKPSVLAHESEPNNESLGTPLTNQAIQRESLSRNKSKNSFNFRPLPSIQWKEPFGPRKQLFDHVKHTNNPAKIAIKEAERITRIGPNRSLGQRIFAPGSTEIFLNGITRDDLRIGCRRSL